MQRNFVSATPTWQETTRAYIQRVIRLVWQLVLPVVALLAVLWWWIAP